MSILEAVILGILQGLTEFLPVSSSGHLAIGKYYFGMHEPDILFDVMLHVATLLVVLIYFRHRVILIIKAFLGLFFRKYQKDYFENKRFLWGIIIASIPTAIIGLLFEKYLLSYFSTTIMFVGYALIVTSILLVISDHFQGRDKIDTPRSIIIGIAQGIAVTPGISRSGTTIAVSTILGIERQEAAEFSFLLSVPAILGAMILQLKDVTGIDNTMLVTYGAGMAAAFLSGLVVIGIMMDFIRKANLKVFAVYCLILGLAVVIFL